MEGNQQQTTENLEKYLLEMDKISSISLRITRQEKAHTSLRNTCENLENHYAMIENFVEKYIPIQVHAAISETLKACLSEKALVPLGLYDKKRS